MFYFSSALPRRFLISTLATLSVCVSACATKTPSAEPTFEEANAAPWQQVMFDSGEDDWRQLWDVDGLIGSVENSDKGMHVKAGPEANNHAHHLVVWTKQSFAGDIKIEYEYTRTDQVNRYVNILYLLATGEGTTDFDKDIMQWAEYREMPYMRHYFDNMDAIHISYAAYDLENTDQDNDYIRVRRYLPLVNNGLANTAIAGDVFKTGLFQPHVPHQITVIKKGKNLWMKVNNQNQQKIFHWLLDSHRDVTEGRIGFRHMFTRSANYQNIKISTLSTQR